MNIKIDFLFFDFDCRSIRNFLCVCVCVCILGSFLDLHTYNNKKLIFILEALRCVCQCALESNFFYFVEIFYVRTLCMGKFWQVLSYLYTVIKTVFSYIFGSIRHTFSPEIFAVFDVIFLFHHFFCLIFSTLFCISSKYCHINITDGFCHENNTQICWHLT